MEKKCITVFIHWHSLHRIFYVIYKKKWLELELISEYSKVAGYEINTKKIFVIFLYTSSNEIEIKKLFMITLKIGNTWG